MINDENWVKLNRERELEVAYIFWSERAQRAYEVGHYKEAASWAQRSLDVNPNQPGVLLILGDAQFAQANFSEAALAYGKALEKTSYGDELVATYADALAAQHLPAQSLEAFQTLLAKRPELKPRLLPGVELAGFTLAARGEEASETVLAPLKVDATAGLPPEARGRLGWWYYRAGKFDRAAELMSGAVQERPADSRMQLQLAWALVEQRNLESAIERFHGVIYQDQVPAIGDWKRHARMVNEAHIGSAVAYWQSHIVDRAKTEFSGASPSQPEWLNPKWVGALYSPGVAKTIEELMAERTKRHAN
jgi:tetratricopeptide (TPR) repeat protein